MVRSVCLPLLLLYIVHHTFHPTMDPLQHPHSDPSASETFEVPVTSKHRKALLRSGQYWLCIGVGMMAMSFAINLFLHNSGTAFVTTSMYVLTTLGTLCLVKALSNFFN